MSVKAKRLTSQVKKRKKNSWGKFMILIDKGRHVLVDVCVCPCRGLLFFLNAVLFPEIKNLLRFGPLPLDHCFLCWQFLFVLF